MAKSILIEQCINGIWVKLIEVEHRDSEQPDVDIMSSYRTFLLNVSKSGISNGTCAVVLDEKFGPLRATLL